jgi:tol-pal system protein YbgF
LWRVCNSAPHFFFGHGHVLFLAILALTSSGIIVIFRIKIMLFRRVFAASLLLSVAVVTPVFAQDSSGRMDQLEEQVRQLTGQVEELTFQIKQMRKAGSGSDLQKSEVAPQGPIQKLVPVQKQATLTLDAPAGSADGDAIEIIGSPETAAVTQPAAPVMDKQAASQDSIYGDDAGQQKLALAPAPSALSRTKSAVPGDGGFQGVMLDANNEPGASATGAITDGSVEQVSLTEDTPESLYKRSDEALLRRQFDVASDGFRKFLEIYPDHSLAGSAKYWLGESYFAQGDYHTAAQNYLEGYQKYPKSRRAPDSLLKLGLALNKLGQKDQGCAALGNVGSEYPKAIEAKKRADVEFRRAGC